MGSCLIDVTLGEVYCGGVAGLVSPSCEPCDSTNDGAGVSALGRALAYVSWVTGKDELTLC